MSTASSIFTAILVVVVVALTLGLVMGMAGMRLANPMSTNAVQLDDFAEFVKYKAAEGVTADALLEAYRRAQETDRLTHTDDLSTIAPHPSVDALSGLLHPTNPWSLPSEGSIRPKHEDEGRLVPHAAAEKVGLGILRRYVDATIGRNVKRKVDALATSIFTGDDHDHVVHERNKTLFRKVFGYNPADKEYAEPPPGHRVGGGGKRVSREAGPWPPPIVALASSTLSLDGSTWTNEGGKHPVMHHGGHCAHAAVKRRNAEGCEKTCGISSATDVRAPFIKHNRVVAAARDGAADSYCWSGQSPVGLRHPAGPDVDPSSHRRCSRSTGQLRFTDDGGWQCTPKFPTLFGGQDATSMTACGFDPALFLGDGVAYQADLKYIDLKSGDAIRSHYEFATQSTYMQKLSSATPKEFIELADDPEFLYRHRVVCDCGSLLDMYRNDVLPATEASRIKFGEGMYGCLPNPCVLTNVARDFVAFDAERGTCTPGQGAPAETVNLVLGDERTPIAGTTTAMGLRLADPKSRLDDRVPGHKSGPFNEGEARRLTRTFAPVIPSTDFSDKNPTRSVLYVPSTRMVMVGPEAHKFINPSTYFHASCLPALLNGRRAASANDPFSTSAFYVEPVADVLNNQFPQKPYELDLLLAESMRNARLVGGNVLGGSELLYSTLLARDKAVGVKRDDRSGSIMSASAGVDGNSKDAGVARLMRIRAFYESMFPRRRLSATEAIQLNELGPKVRQVAEQKFSPWDTQFRSGEVLGVSGLSDVDDLFAVREGLLLRKYGAYGGFVLTKHCDAISRKGMYEPTLDDARDPTQLLLNPAQMSFPTALAALPHPRSPSDIFSVDEDVLFDTKRLAEKFINWTRPTILSTDDGSDAPYAVSQSSKDWGLNSFRYLPKFRNNKFGVLDSRIRYDHTEAVAKGYLMPLDIFRPSLLEWGHPDGDIHAGEWLTRPTDLSATYFRFLQETASVSRPAWFTAVVENDRYHYRRTTTEPDHPSP